MMNLPQCKYIRIRGEDGYEINLEALVKSIELQFETDFTSLPNWKKLLKYIGNKQQDYKSNIQKALCRKFFIINKIHVQNFRLSPFTLTDNLSRTAYLWKEIEMKNKRPRESSKLYVPSSSEETSNISGDETSELFLTAHPNSEIIQSEKFVEPIFQEPLVEDETKGSVAHLPVFICTNQNKFISPLESQQSGFNIQVKETNGRSTLLDSKQKDWVLNYTKFIVSKPSKIEIDRSNLKEQKVTFYLTNSSTEVLHLQFKTISDTSLFKKSTVHPKTPVKLYPGLTASYKFIYKLKPNVNNLNLFLYFRIGQNTKFCALNELLKVPVTLKVLDLEKNISVTERININPVYSWQINVSSNFPYGKLRVSVSNAYFMHIKKRLVNLVDELDDETASITGVNTNSVIQRMEEEYLELDNTLICQSKKDIQIMDMVESINISEIVSSTVEDIIQLALDTFVFEKTFVCLHANSTCTIPVLFSKAEHEGYHHSYYDLNFYDPSTDCLVASRTIKVFAEALAHPIQIQPKILDMSKSSVNFGVREDRVVVTNSHKIYPVTLKIRVTKKMKRLFQISPMEITVPYSSSSCFLVKTCSKQFYNENKMEELVHFTIEINIRGHESVYKNVPPIFYEIIIPCASEFTKIYGGY